MTEKMVEIIVEVLDILATVTKEINQSRASEFVPHYAFLLANTSSEIFVRRMIAGRTIFEDNRLMKLNCLINGVLSMATRTAQVLETTHNIDNEVTGVGDSIRGIGESVQVVPGSLQESESFLLFDNILSDCQEMEI